MQELTEGALFVVAERPAFSETKLAIQAESGLESRARSSFQRQTSVTPLTGLGDEVLENRRRDPFSQMRIGSAHGLDFAGSWPELLQSTEAKQGLALPQCIEADLWLLQSRPTEREYVAWRRAGVHACKMPGQQRLHPAIAKVDWLDDGHWPQDSLSASVKSAPS